MSASVAGEAAKAGRESGRTLAGRWEARRGVRDSGGRPFRSARYVLGVFVVEDRLDHEGADRELAEGDEAPGQDRIDLADPGRAGRQPFQFSLPLVPGLAGCWHRK